MQVTPSHSPTLSSSNQQTELTTQPKPEQETDLDRRIEKVGARATKNSKVIAADAQHQGKRIGKEVK